MVLPHWSPMNHTGINITGILYIYIIYFINSSSDFIVQTAPVRVKIVNTIITSHTHPWMSDPSTIIAKGVGSTTTSVR